MRRRWVQRLLALPLLALLLAGPPTLLITLAPAVQLPAPNSKQLRNWLEQPLDPDLAAVTAWIAGWLIWLLICTAIIAEIVRRLRHGASRLRHIPMPTPFQAVVGGLVGTAVFGSGHTLHAPADPPPTPPPPATPTPAQPDQARSATPGATAPAGVPLPDGSWLPDGLAQTVATTASVLWFNRRQHYQPNTPSTDSPAPLPLTVRAVETALTDPATPRPAPDPHRLLHLPELPRGSLQLAGPGAAAAARGLLLAALLPPAAHRPARVIATHDDLRMLLGHTRTDIPGLHLTEDLPEALHAWHTATTPGNSHDPPGAPPPLLIIGARHHHDAVTALTHPRHAGTAILLGPGHAATRWTVAADGTLAPPAPTRRICVLTPTTATDLLSLAQPADQAQRHETPTPPPAHRASHAAPADRHPPAPAPPAGDTTRLQINVLGGFTVTADGAPITIRRTASRQALALLVVTPEGASTTQLLEAIWPQLPAHHIKGRLYTAISDLRKALTSTHLDHALEHHDDRYRLTPALVDSDLWHLHRLHLHAATTIDPDIRTTTLTALTTAYTGDIAADDTWPWLTSHREHLRRLLLDTYSTLADTTDPRTALHLLQQAIRIDPLNTNIHHRTVTLLRQTGQLNAAETLTDAYNRRLHEQGLRPTSDFGTAG